MNIPLFLSKTPIPLIAIQQQNLHLEIVFNEAPLALDPTYQPVIDVYCDFVYIDDDERRFYTKNEHTLLIERLQIQEDSFDMRQSEVKKLYTVINDTLGDYDTVTGAGVGQTINLGDRIQLVSNPTWTGRTDILYNAAASTIYYHLAGRFSVPSSGSFGVNWATFSSGGTDYGYTMDFSVSSNLLSIVLKRDGTTFLTVSDDSVSAVGRATVTGSSTSTDISAQVSAGEAWVVFDITHDLESAAGITFTITVEGYDAGGYFGDIARVNYFEFTYNVKEGYSSVDTLDKTSTYGFYGDSTYDMVFTEATLTNRNVDILPVSNNLNSISKRLFFRGPIRYLLWHYTYSPASWTFGKFSTDSVDSTTIAHDILYQATILLNANDRTGIMPAAFYSTIEPARVFKRGLPSGLHVYSFCENGNDFTPNGSVNFSRLQSVNINHIFKSYNADVASDLTLLDETESLSSSSNFNRIVTYGIGWNVLYIANGRIALGYV